MRSAHILIAMLALATPAAAQPAAAPPSVVECAAVSLAPETEWDLDAVKTEAEYERQHADVFGWAAIMLRGQPSEAELKDLLLEVMRLSGDDQARKQTIQACASIHVSQRFTDLPAPPAGEPLACLRGAEDALERMKKVQPGHQEQACAAFSELVSAHQDAMRRVETGQVPCSFPRRTWIHHAQLALKSRMMSAAIDCSAARPST